MHQPPCKREKFVDTKVGYTGPPPPALARAGVSIEIIYEILRKLMCYEFVIPIIYF